jgi:hypothetical protein
MSQQRGDEPSAFVGCLGCYNEGRISGKWLTIEQIAEESAEDTPQRLYGGLAVRQANARYCCERCGSDEFEIQDSQWISERLTVSDLYKDAEMLNEVWEQDEEKFHGLMGLLSDGICYTLVDAVFYNDDHFLAASGDEHDLWDGIIDEMLDNLLPQMEFLGQPIADWIDRDRIREAASHDILTIYCADGSIRAYHNA